MSNELPPIQDVDEFLMGFVDAKMGWDRRSDTSDYKLGLLEANS